MNLDDIEKVQHLREQLTEARKVLAAFEKVPGENVPAQALTHTDFIRGPVKSVEIMPVPKALAVSAAKRQISKIVAELQALGVQV